MQYGICSLSVIPLRHNPDDSSEMLSQILYGEHFKVLEQRKYWSRIRSALDCYEGWLSNNQILSINQFNYEEIENAKNRKISSDLVSFVTSANETLTPIVIGSSLSVTSVLPYTFEGSFTSTKKT